MSLIPYALYRRGGPLFGRAIDRRVKSGFRPGRQASLLGCWDEAQRRFPARCPFFCCRRTCASGVRRCWIIVCVACSDSRPPWQEFLLVAFTVGILSPFLFLAVADPMKTPAVGMLRQLADDPNAPVTNAVLSAEIVQVDKLAMEEMMPFSTVVLTIF